MRRCLGLWTLGFWCVAAVFGAASAARVALAQGPQPTARSLQPQSVRYGVTLSHDTVTVGQPFEIRVRISAPLGAVIKFPDNPDTAGSIQARDPRSIVTLDSVNTLDQVATYHVAAWNLNRVTARFSDAVVTWNTPASRGEQRVPLTNIGVFVQTVLPADTALRKPKPARPLWEVTAFPWWIVAVAAAAIALAYWWWRRRRRRAMPVAVAVKDPYERAVADFARIEAMGLLGAGERTRFVSLVVEVLRDYLAARYPDAPLALTSRELIHVLRKRSAISGESLMRVLHDADLAKFAGLALAEDRVRGVARDAKAIVEREHAATLAAQEAAAEQAA